MKESRTRKPTFDEWLRLPSRDRSAASRRLSRKSDSIATLSDLVRREQSEPKPDPAPKETEPQKPNTATTAVLNVFRYLLDSDRRAEIRAKVLIASTLQRNRQDALAFLGRWPALNNVVQQLKDTYFQWTPEGYLNFLSIQTDLKRLLDDEVSKFNKWAELARFVRVQGQPLDSNNFKKLVPGEKTQGAKSNWDHIREILER